jgi:hypothetical protein
VHTKDGKFTAGTDNVTEFHTDYGSFEQAVSTSITFTYSRTELDTYDLWLSFDHAVRIKISIFESNCDTCSI